ncbi:Callose synthase 7 [Morella rubra]|uniref:Callose synthase 7 n=1 Tax=Morella rubra TaxID=262757 RepID=A0A6A1VA09_9ROSI|nr:Callose synthase 7 [Morella rubra]
MDPTSKGRGVRQFKTYLLHRLEREEEETECILASTDPREIQLYYQKFYEENVRDCEHKKPEEIAKIFQTATVLYEALKTVVPLGKIDAQTERYAKDVERKMGQYEPYNILPLHAVGVKPPIMEIPEIKAALHALQNVDNLPMPRIHSTPGVQTDESVMATKRVKAINDILDWLQYIFGFQLFVKLISKLFKRVNRTVVCGGKEWCGLLLNLLSK